MNIMKTQTVVNKGPIYQKKPYIAYPENNIDPLTIIKLPVEYFKLRNIEFNLTYRAYNCYPQHINMTTYEPESKNISFADGDSVDNAVFNLHKLYKS